MTGAPEYDVTEEHRRSRQLRILVDLTCNVIAQGRLTRAEAQDLVDAARRRILELFPGKEDTFDLVLAPRFARLINEFARTPAARKVLPFAR